LWFHIHRDIDAAFSKDWNLVPSSRVPSPLPHLAQSATGLSHARPIN